MAIDYSKLKQLDRKAVYQWGGAQAPYAPLVCLGYVSRSGKQMPARDWTESAVKDLDVATVFARAYQNNGGNLEAALEETAKQLSEQFQKEFDDSKWDWPTVTKRRSGEVVGSPRNIIDSQALKDSQSLSFEAT